MNHIRGGIPSPNPDFPQEIVNVGNKNLLNKVNSEEGGIDTSGNLITGNTLWRGTEYIKVKPNTKYTFSCNETMTLRLYQYNSEKTFLSPRNEGATTTSFTITTGSTTEYLKWSIYKSGTTVMSDIINDLKLQIEESPTTTEYISYNCIAINKYGKNLFVKDCVIANQNYDNDGNIVSSDYYNRSLLYIYCHNNSFLTISGIDNTSYTNGRLIFYDENKQFLDYFSVRNRKITIPNTAYYFRLACPKACIDTLQIEFGESATEYEATKTYNFPLSTGQKLMQGDYLASNGIHFVKTRTILNGTETWKDYSTQIEGYYKAYTTTKTLVADITGNNTKSNYFEVFPISDINNENIGLFGTQYGIYINVPNSIASNYTELVEWLTVHNVEIEYPRATELVVPYTQEQQTIYDEIISDGTYKGTTNYAAIANIDPDMEITYYKDLETIINNLDNRLSLLE